VVISHLLSRVRSRANDPASAQPTLRTAHHHQTSTREPPRHRGRHDHPHQTDPPRGVTTSKEAPKMTNMAQPLAARMRPTSLDEIVGQDHLVYDGSPLSLLADGQSRSSVLLYAPPGTRKTSIARVIAVSTDQRFAELSATSAGVKQVRDEIAAAVKVQQEDNRVTVLFLDEIHRFSKAQQDVLLDAVEHGKIALIDRKSVV